MKYVITKNDAISVVMQPTRTVYLWADKHTGAKQVSGGTAEIPAGSENSAHIHETEEEIMFIYEGNGQAIFDGQTFPVGPETIMFAPPGVKHQVKSTGPGTLKFAFFYAPPGPEQIVRELAKKK
jgi:mannose-6-phosphate isomerase-like protein (cupin superfamily)